MKVTVYSVSGKATKKEAELPEVFEEDYRPDVITRAVVAIQSSRLQPKGVKPGAGMDTSAEYVGRRRAFRSGINRALARLPRTKPGGGGLGNVRRVPQAVGGRRAHPPKVEKKIRKQINRKERKLAIRSAIAATCSVELVKARGHKMDGVTVPVVVEDKLESLDKTKEVVKLVENLGLGREMERAARRTVRAGKGKRRGRKYRKKKSFLVVVSEDRGISRGCGNLPGVDVSTVESLNAELLAPGTHAGRLTIWSESAVRRAGEAYGH
jgi:large subunit ribosomal protein L4e